LIVEELRTTTRDPQTADPQGRVVLVIRIRERERLVTSGIQRPNDHLAAGEGSEHAAVCGGLFLDRRGVRPVQEAELRPEQPHTLRARRRGVHGVRRPSDVREQRDAVPVCETPGPVELHRGRRCRRFRDP